jgi:hypothetical protein
LFHLLSLIDISMFGSYRDVYRVLRVTEKIEVFFIYLWSIIRSGFHL